MKPRNTPLECFSWCGGRPDILSVRKHGIRDENPCESLPPIVPENQRNDRTHRLYGETKTLEQTLHRCSNSCRSPDTTTRGTTKKTPRLQHVPKEPLLAAKILSGALKCNGI